MREKLLDKVLEDKLDEIIMETLEGTRCCGEPNSRICARELSRQII